MITAMPSKIVADDSGCLLAFTGEPNRSVLWALAGSGSLAVLTNVTDANGVALARYTAGTAGTAPIISVTYAS